MSGKRWFPLESNPEVMNGYISELGFSTKSFQFCDVMSIEEWALEMVPSPVLAVMLLFPVKPVSETHRREEALRIESEGQILPERLFYMKQTIGNACGTIGLLHGLANCRDVEGVEIAPDSYLSRFFSTTLVMNPDERGAWLEQDDEIEQTHESAAGEGQSAQQDEEVDSHFICFSHVDGCLFELDGRKSFPINHGPSSRETLLQDACKVIQAFMARDPDEVRFTIVALARSGETDE